MRGNPAQDDWEDVLIRIGNKDKRKRLLESALPAGMKVVPLEEALESVGVPKAKDVANICSDNANNLEDVDPELISYVFAYTFDFGDESLNQQNPYSKINRALLKGTFLDLNDVKHLIFGLLSALRTLPYGTFDVLYRGLKNRVDWNVNDLKLTMTSFTS